MSAGVPDRDVREGHVVAVVVAVVVVVVLAVAFAVVAAAVCVDFVTFVGIIF